MYQNDHHLIAAIRQRDRNAFKYHYQNYTEAIKKQSKIKMLDIIVKHYFSKIYDGNHFVSKPESYFTINVVTIFTNQKLIFYPLFFRLLNSYCNFIIHLFRF